MNKVFRAHTRIGDVEYGHSQSRREELFELKESFVDVEKIYRLFRLIYEKD